MRYGSLFAVIVVCLALSCAAPATSPGQPANAEMDAFIGGAVVLSPDVPATVKIGGEFAVVLKGNPSAGYQWTYAVEPTGLAGETAQENFSAVPEPMIGSPVFTVWKFTARAEGEAVLTYLHYRPWEKPETAIDRAVYTVKIVK
jgi:predicted secreted protein